jgi:hypothetical protein
MRDDAEDIFPLPLFAGLQSRACDAGHDAKIADRKNTIALNHFAKYYYSTKIHYGRPGKQD